MKPTFFHNLRHKLLEIFHPRDFRKIRRCKCSETNNQTEGSSSVTPCVAASVTSPMEISDSPLDTLSTTVLDDTSNNISESTSTIENHANIESTKSFQTLSESISMVKANSVDTTTQLLSKSELESQSHSESQSQSQSHSESQSQLPSSNEINVLTASNMERDSVNLVEDSSTKIPSSTDISSEDNTGDRVIRCKNPERDLLLKRILIKVLIICTLALLTLLIAPKSRANDHQSMVALSLGVLYPNGLDATAEYQRSTSYHSAWAVELNGYRRWRKCPDCQKVCADSFWQYYHSYHIGMVYKPCVYRDRNQHGRLRLGVSLGYDDRKILGGILLGYEQTYCLAYGCEIFWTAKMDIHSLAKTWVRPGISFGLRLPI